MELISIVILIVIISKLVKNTKNLEEKTRKNISAQKVWEQTETLIQNAWSSSSALEGNEKWKQAARENIEKAKKRAAQKERQNDSAMQQVYKGRMEANGTSILERAKANVLEKGEDITLASMEKEHNHSERVSSAKHEHPEDSIPENMLGTIEDLMIKGYEGNLCFERDFLGEAMDMINRFTIS